MEPSNGTPQIVPGNADVMGGTIQLLAYCDPAQFPNGLEVVVFVPGNLKPIGRGVVMPGSSIAGLDPKFTAALLDQVRHAAASQQRPGPGQTRAPGMV